MKKCTKWILLIIAVLIIGGIVASIFLRPGQQPQYSTAQVYRGELKRTVSASGVAQPNRIVNLAFEKSGLVSALLVQVGDAVKVGDLLLNLDARAETQQLEQAQVNLNLANSNLKIAQTDDLAAAELAYKKVYQNYLDTKAANDRSLQEAELAFAEAKNYTRDYQEYFDEVNSEYNDGNTTKMARDLARASLTQIQGTEQKAKEALESLKITTKSAEDAAWYAQAEARETLEKQKAIAYDWDKSSLLNQADLERVALDLARLNLEKTNLRTPLAGVVSKINVQEGELISAFNPFLTLISPDLEIEAKVPEADIAKIKLGQETEIIFDALSDQVFEGKVSAIEPAETIIEGVTYYKIKIDFSDPDDLVKSGLSADLTINIYGKSDVLIAPQRAVKEKDGRRYVQVKIGEAVSEVDVVTGLQGDGGTVEILQGLQEGDIVVTFVKE